MAVNIQFDSSRFDETIRTMLQRTEHMQVIMDRVAADMLKETQMNFRRESSPEKMPWDPLSSVTLRRRRKQGRGAKILQDTGQLIQSLATQSKATRSQAYAQVGTNKDYAKKQQFGDRRIPARSFIGFNNTMRKQYNKWIMDYITGGRT